MKTIGIFYGSSTGTTEGIAKRIAEKLGVEDKDIHDVSNASPADVAPYEILLLGCSTWGAGDLQDDWDSYLGKLKMTAKEKKKLILSLTKEMQEASRNLEFERAAQIRDIIFELNEKK